jgi:hypothetical protein
VLFVATAAGMNAFVPADKAVTLRSAGYDFLAFYTAGSFVRTGRARELYDLPAVRAFEHEVARREGLELREESVGPYWNPPLLAWAFVPLSALPYRTAWFAWTIVNLACFAGAVGILASLLAQSGAAESAGEAPVPGPTPQHARIDWRTWGLVPLLTATSVPFIEALGLAQNTCVSLLIVSAAVALWRRGRGLAAGAVVGLLFYKPQLSALLAAALVVSCGWRAVAGLAMTGSAVLLATSLTLPGTILYFLRKLPANIHIMQVERVYLWDRHVTLKAFWRLLVQGFDVGEATRLTQVLYLITAAAAAACLVAMIFKLRRREDAVSRGRLIGATVVAMPLLMPFYFDYDLLLLAVPATLLACEAAATGEKTDRKLVAAWAALYAWLMVNAAVAEATRVNGTVVLLAVVAGMMVRRAMKVPAVERRVDRDLEATPLLRAA